MDVEDDAAVLKVRSVLGKLSAAVAARDAPATGALFEPRCLLVGTTGHAVGNEARTGYLQAVVTQAGQLSWDWQDVLVSHTKGESIIFLALGEVVLTEPDREDRSPIRLSGVLRRDGSDQWRFAHFHGSTPAT